MNIDEFLTVKTLEAIDWGVLDLSKVRIEKRQILYRVEFLLTSELRDNYANNSCGIFRVSRVENLWVYSDKITSRQFSAESIQKLEEIVVESNSIWYVFDEELARGII